MTRIAFTLISVPTSQTYKLILWIILIEHSEDYKDLDVVLKWAQSSGVSTSSESEAVVTGLVVQSPQDKSHLVWT